MDPSEVRLDTSMWRWAHGDGACTAPDTCAGCNVYRLQWRACYGDPVDEYMQVLKPEDND